MSQATKLQLIPALMLACAALAGCGAGDPGAPPPPVASVPPAAGPDTTPPTVTIASNVSAAVATGPVTFTFVFSEDVGVSFTEGDIVVTGGTASGFNRISGRQATIVVTPTANASGTLTVSVAAGSFTDIANNANTAAASAAKDYAPPPPPPPPTVTGLLLANFDTVSPPIAGFEGGEGSAVEPGPAGGSGNALKVLRSGGQAFALAIVSLPSSIPLEAGRLTISARVNSPTAGIPMVLKLEGTAGSPSSGDLQANETVVVGWQTLTWTVPAVNTNYNTLVLLPNLGTVDAPPGKAYYFDDIQLLPASSAGGTLLANFDTVSPPIAGFEGGEGSAVEPGPTGGSGNALKVLRSGGQTFALAIVTLPSNVPLAAGRLTISARVNSPTAGIPMVLKLEGPAGNPSSGDLQANETVVVGWQTLTWTVPAVNTNYNTLVLLPNLGTVDAPPGKAYYFDDITLLGTAPGGGGGGGGSSPLTFSSGFGSGNRTVEGGEFGGFSGSDQDGFFCSGADASKCGGGGDTTASVAAADSFFFRYHNYQAPTTPASALYVGVFVLAPGVTGGLSNTADSPGVQIGSQTTVKFKLGQNADWFGTAANRFAVDLTLGKRYVVGGNTCRVQLRRIVTPTAAAATAYTVALSEFSVVQDCAQGGLTVAAALAASPISQVSFQGAAGGAALSAGGQTTGANLSVANGGVYASALSIVGGITFE